MSFEIAWSREALWIWYRLSRHSATIVDRAVIRFAATGEGEVSWEPPFHHLAAGRYRVWIAIDLAARRVSVIHIQRAR